MKTLALGILSAIAFLATVAHGTTLTVSSSDDSGAGTLRQLMADATDGDTIEIPAGMTITVSSTLTLPAKSLNFVGGMGATVSGGGLVPVFIYGRSGADTASHAFTFTGLTIADGYATNKAGAGIFIDAGRNADYRITLVLNDCTFLRNRNTGAQVSGGALAGTSEWGSIYATNCVFRGNCAQGAVLGTAYNSLTGGEIVFSHCTMADGGTGDGSDGHVYFRGAAILGSARRMLIDRCTFAGNLSSNKMPCVYKSYTTTNITNYESICFRMADSLVSNNTSTVEGACFDFKGGTNLIERTRVVCNRGDNTTVAIVGEGITDFRSCLFDDNLGLSTFPPGQYNNYGLFAYIAATNAVLGCPRLTFADCSMRRNVQSGGYLIKCKCSGGDFSMSRCVIEDNRTGLGGLLEMTSCNAIRLVDTSFVNNCTNGYAVTAGSGNAIASNLGARSVVSNCTFFANNCELFRAIVSGALADAYHCAFVSNKVVNGFFAYRYTGMSVSPALENSVFIDNTPNVFPVEYSGSVLKPNEGIRGNVLTTGISWVDPNLAAFADRNLVKQSLADVKFVFPPAENGSKFKLLDGTSPKTLAFAPGSVLRDMVHVVPGSAFDARGKKRDAKPDVGPYEHVNAALSLSVR